jgi:hypothetical protein
MIADAELDQMSPEDEAAGLAWALADRFQERTAQRQYPPVGYGLKGVSELIYRVARDNPGHADAIATQVEAMAGYVRRHMK